MSMSKQTKTINHYLLAQWTQWKRTTNMEVNNLNRSPVICDNDVL